MAFVPAFVLVLCSGWRTTTLLARMREKKGVEKRKAVLKQLGALVVDLPYVLMGLLLLLTLWRAPLLIADAREQTFDGRGRPTGPGRCKRLRELRDVIAIQFGCLLRDLPCFGLLLLLAATLYRLPPTLLKLRAATKRLLLDPDVHPPALTAVTARAALTAKGAVRLVVRGTKPAGFAPARLDLAVGGAPFWEAAEETFGGTAALGKTFLPLQLASKHLRPGSLKEGETEATLDITIGASRKAVESGLSKLAACGNPLITLQLAHGRGAGLAVQLCFKPSQLQAAFGISPHPSAAEADAEGLRELGLDLASSSRSAVGEVPWLQDAFWSVVVAESLVLARDVTHAVLGLALAVAPWRQLQLLTRLLEPKAVWAERRALGAHALLLDEQRRADAALDASQAALALQARGGERDYPLPPASSFSGRGFASEAWRPPPPTPTRLYTGRADAETGRTWALKGALKELRKHAADELLALWERRLDCNRLRHLAIVLQAELGRGVLVTEHWLETRHALRLVVSEAVGDGLAGYQAGGPSQRRSQALGSARTSVSLPTDYARAGLDVLPPLGRCSQAHLAQEPRALLRRAHELLAATADTEAELRDEIARVAAARRAAIRCCRLSPVALCKRSAGKSQALVRWHLKAAALDYLTVLGGCVLLLSHRGPTLLRQLRGARCLQSATLAVALQAREAVLDALLLAEAVLITLTLYQALEFWLETSDALLRRGDVACARKRAHRRVQRIVEDAWEVFLVWPFLCESYRFLAATLLFGTLVPIELVGRLVGKLCCAADTRRRAASQQPPPTVEIAEITPERKSDVTDHWARELRLQRRREEAGRVTQAKGVVGTTRLQFGAGALVWGGIVAFPFVLVLLVAPAAVLEGTGGVLRSVEARRLLLGLLGGYVGLLLLIGLLSSCAARSSAALIAIPYPRSRLRLTGANVGALLAVGLEIAQLVALPFLALHAAGAALTFSPTLTQTLAQALNLTLTPTPTPTLTLTLTLTRRGAASLGGRRLRHLARPRRRRDGLRRGGRGGDDGAPLLGLLRARVPVVPALLAAGGRRRPAQVGARARPRRGLGGLAAGGGAPARDAAPQPRATAAQAPRLQLLRPVSPVARGGGWLRLRLPRAR